MFGGPSEERFVSVASAQNLASRMARESDLPFSELWFVTPQGEVQIVSMETLQSHKDPFKTQFDPKEKVILGASMGIAISKLSKASRESTVAFLGFHGTFGEDGRIQGLLEENDIAFTGSNSSSSHLCFEKNLAKEVAEKNGLVTAPGLLLSAPAGSPTDFETSILPRLRDFFQKYGKIVVKPVANGSSIGLHIIGNQAQFEKAAIEIGKSKSMGTFLAEKFIEGRELTVGIIEKNGQLMALPPSEVVLGAGGTFDYDGKYLGRGTTEITPAQITPSEALAAQKAALTAHKALGCFGYTRTDVILRPEGILFIETNTLPGLTKASFIPQQLEAAKISMTGFVEEQLNLALRRD